MLYVLMEVAQESLPDLKHLVPTHDPDVIIVPKPAATPLVLSQIRTPLKTSPATLLDHSGLVPGSTITLVFQGDIWVSDNEARSGYTLVSASNGLVNWDAQDANLDRLKAACYKVAVSDVTKKSIESFLIRSNKGTKVRGEWTCWITNTRSFPKTARLRVKLTQDNVEAWLKEAYGLNKEAGLYYRAYNPKKVEAEANVVSEIVAFFFLIAFLIIFLSVLDLVLTLL